MAKRRNPITYYMDAECKNRYPVNESGQPILDWGIITPGQKKEKTLYGKNESKDRLVLRQPYTLDEALTITDYSPNIDSGAVGFVSFELAPKHDTIDSHKTDWGFDVLIGG